jgi:PAS domain S-box-containing protein
MVHKNSRALLRETLENMRVAMFVATPEGGIVDVNRSACELLGYTREELLAMGIADILGPETAERIRMAMRDQSLEGETPIESKGFRKDGAPIPVQLSNTMIKIDGKEMVVTMMRALSGAKE